MEKKQINELKSVNSFIKLSAGYFFQRANLQT